MIANVSEKSRVFKKEGEFEAYIAPKTTSDLRRFTYILINLVGLSIDSSIAYFQAKKEKGQSRNKKEKLATIIINGLRIFKGRKYAKQTYGVQLRSRLTNMGATFIKFGQMLGARTDILPTSVTNELDGFYDKLTVIPFEEFKSLVEQNLNRPVKEVFSRIVHTPLAAGSIAQVHLATLISGEDVVIKLVKPGVNKQIHQDVKIIRFIGRLLQKIMPRFQPEAMLNEFANYTTLEVDLVQEANNIEEFTTNFDKESSVVFPKVYRNSSNRNMLTMEFLAGLRPDTYVQQNNATYSMRSNIANIGTSAIIKMMYGDGFFHADLHVGNLLVIDEKQCAFIDLGMVGRFSESTKKNLMYYNNALVQGNFTAAARYMSLIAKPGKHADVIGFKKEFAAIAQDYHKNSKLSGFSVAELIMKTTKLGAKYDLYFPMELILMSKAMITFEGVGEKVLPGLNIVEVSKKHIRKHIYSEEKLKAAFKSSISNAPEFLELLTQGPGKLIEFMDRVEEEPKAKPSTRSYNKVLVAIASILFLSAATTYGLGGEIEIYIALFVLGVVSALKA